MENIKYKFFISTEELWLLYMTSIAVFIPVHETVLIVLISVLEIVGLRVPARYIRDFALFNVCSSCKNCSSAGCASAANVVCRDVDVFGARNVLLNRFYSMILLLLLLFGC
jgi:hypothetical protein